MFETLQKISMKPTINIPITEYLHSNAALSSTEDQSVHAESLILEADISRIASEIEQLQSTLQRLTTKHREKSDLLTSYRALRAPIRRLPPEILGNIFLKCLSDWPHGEPKAGETHIILEKVCSYWRKILMHTPELWADLSIPSHWISRGTATNFANLWLSRSGDLPLSIKLPSEARSASIIHPRYEHRCRKLVVPVNLLVSHSLKVDAKSFPTLEEIIVTGEYKRSFEVSGPMIKQAEIEGILTYRAAYNMLPWSQLTQLGFRSRFVGFAPLALLSKCSNLEELNSVFLGFNASTPSGIRTKHPESYPLIVLPKLHTWDMSITGVFKAENLLDTLIVPSLRKLELWCNNSSSWVRIRPEILSLISRSSCPLEHFKIRVFDLRREGIFPFYEEGVIQLVQSCPSLRTLHIYYSDQDVVYPSVTELLACRNR